MDINNILSGLEAKHPGEKEYLQAVKEVLICVEDEIGRASCRERVSSPV